MRHEITQISGQSQRFSCQRCGATWLRNSSGSCPGVRWYAWRSAPSHLQTYSQLRAKHMKPVDRAKPDGVLLLHDEWLYLYDERQAIQRRQCSERQRQALEVARQRQLEKWKCQGCGREPDSLSDYCHHFKGGSCDDCIELGKIEYEQWKHENMLREDCNAAILWAQGMLARDDWAIIDTETTSLTGVVVDLAVIAPDGSTLFHSLVNPECAVEPGARAVHGITDDELATAPTLPDLWPDLQAALAGRSLILTYNAAFDEAVMLRSAGRYQLPALAQKWDCIMEWYAQYFGEWSSYHGDYKWQPLNGGHRALDDALAALECLKGMATAAPDEEE